MPCPGIGLYFQHQEGTPPPENEGGYVQSRKPLGNISGYSVLEKESPAEAGLKLRFALLAIDVS
jgi:hypothetical protein